MVKLGIFLSLLSICYADEIYDAVYISQATYCNNDLIETWSCATCEQPTTEITIIELTLTYIS